MLTAYMDESGHEADRVVLAGFLGNRDQWKLFEAAWRKGLGRRRNLHMKELRWHKPERIKELLASLAPIPYRCGLTALYSTVLASDYSDLIVGTPRPDHGQELACGFDAPVASNNGARPTT